MIREVVVVGGGPVGLLLGCRLRQLGIDCVVLEAQQRPTGSRAIGIHPPSLATLEELGVLSQFLREGVRITRAHAFSTRRHLGSVDLSRGGARFGFVLSVPQDRNEAILSCALGEQLLRGVQVVEVRARDAGVDVIASEGSHWRARWVIGCDGGRSLVAASVGATFSGSRSTAGYVMGDFDDSTSFGVDAAIFLADEGLVETFPLPSARRRWVVEVDARRAAVSADDIAGMVRRRTGIGIAADSASMLSAFGVLQLCASRLVGDGRLLAGDAAHVISPFGGQGMNVGWADASDVAECLRRILREGADGSVELDGYERRCRRRARRAIRRAAFNGAVGRRSRHPRARNAAVGALLHAAPQALLARMFTMLPLWRSPDRRSGGRQDDRDAVLGGLVEPRAWWQP